MPNSDTVLEELICRVLGDFILEDCAAKIADDLYCEELDDTPQELISAWSRILEALSRCSLTITRFFACKTYPPKNHHGSRLIGLSRNALSLR